MSNKFKDKIIINNKLQQRGNIKKLKKGNFVHDEVTLTALPTPKQEIIAEHLKNINKNFYIRCIGGGLKMASGEEKPPPKFLENYGLEPWRLRNDTLEELIGFLFIFSIFY